MLNNKADQKQLKALYSEELKKVWESPKMQEWCLKQSGYLFECDGHLFSIEKPKIQTEFCYGHGFCGVTTQEEEDRAAALAYKAENDFNYFIEKNTESINRQINQLKDILDTLKKQGYSFTNVCLQPKYNDNTNIYSFFTQRSCDRSDNDKSIIAGADFIEQAIAALEEVKKAFMKRLNTYLKRYGLTKVRSWTYLSD